MSFEIGLELARRAGDMLMERYEKLDGSQIENKGSWDLVTEADTAVETFLAAEIARRCPDHGFHGEEFTRSGADRPCQWVVDPLDGTVNFAHGLPIFAVSIGFVREGIPEWGIVHAPRLGETFTARRGEGAHLGERPLSVSSSSKLEEAVCVTGFACKRYGREERNLQYFREIMKAGMGIRRLGSAALDLCFVAAGRLDGFWEFDLNPWDKAAGGLIVQEAGGRVTDLEGEGEWLTADAIVASNGLLHEELLRRFAAPDGDGMTLARCKQEVAKFVNEREWLQFHNPKNLAMSISIEAAELMEHFQWLGLDEAEAKARRPEELAEIQEELADVFNYCCSLANVLGVDLGTAFLKKIEKNRAKYPVDEYRGKW